MSVKLNTEDFIAKANSVHNGKHFQDLRLWNESLKMD